MGKFELKSDKEIRKMSKDEVIKYILELRKYYLKLNRQNIEENLAKKIINIKYN